MKKFTHALAVAGLVVGGLVATTAFSGQAKADSFSFGIGDPRGLSFGFSSGYPYYPYGYYPYYGPAYYYSPYAYYDYGPRYYPRHHYYPRHYRYDHRYDHRRW